jgi:hypothetical protein
MLETLAIAALIVGSLSGATVVANGDSVADSDRQPVTAEVQRAEVSESEAAQSPFLDS